MKKKEKYGKLKKKINFKINCLIIGKNNKKILKKKLINKNHLHAVEIKRN